MAIKTEDVAEIIILKVRGLNNGAIRFKINKRTRLMKLIRKYCQRIGIAMASVTFKFDGQIIGRNDNAFSMNMEDGDIIKVYRRQNVRG